MLIGLISDTHGLLRPEVFDHFRGVELILHAGDIGPPHILVELQAIAPVAAVWGNTDSFEMRAAVEEIAEREVLKRRIVVVHGHQLGSLDPASLRKAHPHADIIVFGHTHRPTLDRSEGRIVVNPGGAGAPRFGLAPTVALLELEEGRDDIRLIQL